MWYNIFMIALKQINELTIDQACYLAGFIDGEGSVGIVSGRIRISITQAESGKHILYTIKEWIGAGTVGLHRPAQGNWQAVYRYRLQSTSMCVQLYKQIGPYLRIKGDLLENYKSPLKGASAEHS